jgi:hypothetical protein
VDGFSTRNVVLLWLLQLKRRPLEAQGTEVDADAVAFHDANGKPCYFDVILAIYAQRKQSEAAKLR